MKLLKTFPNPKFRKKAYKFFWKIRAFLICKRNSNYTVYLIKFIIWFHSRMEPLGYTLHPVAKHNIVLQDKLKKKL